jgi:hypothetical protein
MSGPILAVHRAPWTSRPSFGVVILAVIAACACATEERALAVLLVAGSAVGVFVALRSRTLHAVTRDASGLQVAYRWRHQAALPWHAITAARTEIDDQCGLPVLRLQTSDGATYTARSDISDWPDLVDAVRRTRGVDVATGTPGTDTRPERVAVGTLAGVLTIWAGLGMIALTISCSPRPAAGR